MSRVILCRYSYWILPDGTPLPLLSLQGVATLRVFLGLLRLYALRLRLLD